MKDSVIISTPYKGTEIKQYKIINDSTMQIGSNIYHFRFFNKYSALINLNYKNIQVEFFKKSDKYKELNYLQRYVIYKINSDTTIGQKVKDSIISNIKIGIFPKNNLGDFEDEIQIDSF